MEIKAVRMFDGGFMTQPFAFGGEEGKEAFDEQIIYRSSLQNFLIDTGEEVILIDTGFKNGAPAPEMNNYALKTMQVSVNDVAQQCGFNETSSFSRTFKRIYGVAPSQYVA